MPNGTTKTLAIRLDEGLHAQLSVLAQLNGTTVTEAIRQSIEAYVQAARSQGDLAARAASVVEDIEREASTRRSAIEALFGTEPTSADAAPATSTARKSGRAGRSEEGS